MNKKILFVVLGAACCVGSDSNAADFGRRFGANGYINNMPLYFKDYNTRGKQHKRKLNARRQARTNRKAKRTTKEKVNAKHAAAPKNTYRQRKAARLAARKADMNNQGKAMQLVAINQQPSHQRLMGSKQPQMTKQQAELELKKARLQQELAAIEKQKRRIS